MKKKDAETLEEESDQILAKPEEIKNNDVNSGISRLDRLETDIKDLFDQIEDIREELELKLS